MRRALLILLMWGGAAVAAPDTSLRPMERPAELNTTRAPLAAQRSGARMEQSLRPEARSKRIKRQVRDHMRLRKAGAVCGDLDIQGEEFGTVTSKTSGCGVVNAVRIRSVSGITLSQLSIMDCTTAKALKTWVDNTAKPVLRSKGGGLKSLRVAAHYVCKTRNSQSGARISEHGKGRAIDISGVQLKDGSTITVLRGWNSNAASKEMRALHKGACGPFGTVLGPNSDRYHKAHFHFDTARYRGGPYCR